MSSQRDREVPGTPRWPQAQTGSRPLPLGDANRHYWLALEMASTVGLDLQAEMDEGRLSHEDWAETVTRCRGCDWAGGCPAWMSAQRLERDAAGAAGSAAGRIAAPPSCANASTFNTLLGLSDPSGGGGP